MYRVNTQIEEALKILKSGNRQDAERALETLQGKPRESNAPGIATHYTSMSFAAEGIGGLSNNGG
jgi:hypothetical protein